MLEGGGSKKFQKAAQATKTWQNLENLQKTNMTSPRKMGGFLKSCKFIVKSKNRKRKAKILKFKTSFQETKLIRDQRYKL